MKRIRIIMAVAAVVAIALTAIMPSYAATAYTPVAGTSFTFNKYLIVEAGTEVPNASFSYTVAPGTARSADTSDNTVMQVLAGVGAPAVSSTVFAPGDATLSSAGSYIDVARAASDRAAGFTSATGVELNTADGEKFAVKQATVDFTGVTFNEPGIYRYIITETASASDAAKGIIHDNDTDRVLDVYVIDNGTGTLVVQSYVLHTEDGDVNINAEMGSADVASAGDPLSDKTDGFTNEYKTSDLSFRKEITGNQASRDKYFEFTLSITGLTEGDVYNVDLTHADATSGSTAATRDSNRSKSNPAQLTASASGAVTAKYYLQHGQDIKVIGLPLNASYSVTEDPEDYASAAASVTGFTDPVTGTMANDVKTSYTNTRNGVIPTGILTMVAPYVGMVAVAGAALTLIIILKKKKRNGNKAV